MVVQPATGESVRGVVAHEVGAVVVHYQNADDTERCLESLFAAGPRPRVIVVVDNSPGDGSLERLEGWALRTGARCRKVPAEPHAAAAVASLARQGDDTIAVFVPSPANRGFAAGVNLGWHVLRGVPGIVYLLLLNNDATVARNFLTPLLEALRANPRGGLAAATIRLVPPRDGIWFAGGELVWSQCRGRHLHQPSGTVREITFCTGCCALVRMETMEMVAGMPECYFLYLEDTEFSLRIRRAGRALLYAPESTVFHQGSASAGARRTSAQSSFLAARNRCWFARRNLATWQQAIAVPRVVLDEVGRAAGAGVRGRWDVSWAIVRGLFAGLVGSWQASAER